MNKFTLGFAVAAVIALAAITGAWLAGLFASDEAPIIVKNGTMKIESGHGTFEPDGDDYSHETRGDSQKSLWVKVYLNGTVSGCSDTSTQAANLVTVEYSTGRHSLTVHFKPTDRQGVFRTKIETPGSKPWKRVRPYRLVNTDDPNDGTPYITMIKAGSWKCEMTAKEQLEEINICSSSTTAHCQ